VIASSRGGAHVGTRKHEDIRSYRGGGISGD
jgi:hypothetical protein